MVWNPSQKIIDTRFIGQNILQYIADNQADALLWANGITSWKSATKVAAQINIDLTAPGATVDGIEMTADDRVLVKSQTLPAQNGLYVWNGAAVPMARAADANTTGELNGSAVLVESGTSANHSFKQTGTVAALETDSIVWAEFAAARKPFEMFLESIANNDLPIFPSLIILDDGNATDFDSDLLESAYEATFEAMVAGKIAANVPDTAKRYAYALESMLRNIPKTTLLASSGISTMQVGGMETGFDVLKNNEQKTVFYQLFQTKVIYRLYASAQ